MADKQLESNLIRSLEPRLMFDAAAAETHTDVSAQQVDHALPGSPSASDAPSPAPTTPADDAQISSNGRLSNAGLFPSTTAGNELNAIAAALADHTVSSQTGQQFVFVDTSVTDYQTLLTGINPTAQVVLINTQQDGIGQIQAALAGQHNVEAIYLISHGTEGQIELGSSRLNFQTISGQYAQSLINIGQSLAINADILVYGCDFAAGPAGMQAVNELAMLTGAHVAASNDNSGSAALGGDWNLEVKTGVIDATQVLSQQALADYPYLLDLPTPFSLSQSFSGSSQGTVTGPHYIEGLTTTAKIADGQSLSNFQVSQMLPNNIIVTGITPDTGGVISSLTLENGAIIIDKTAISSVLASGAFLQAYTVEYATLSATKSTTLAFFVPEFDANGNAIIDLTTGAPVSIKIEAATGNGDWSSTTSQTSSSVSVSSNGIAFIAKSIAIQDNVKIHQDLGALNLTPGDNLQHNLQINVSDYFSFGANADHSGQWLVRDVLSDGQTFDAGFVPTLNYTDGSGSHSVTLVRGVNFFLGNSTGDNSGNKDSGGKTYITFDLAQAFSHLSGSLHDVNAQDYKSEVLISFRSNIDNTYTTIYPQSFLTEGDSVTNQVSLQATLLNAELHLTGSSNSDTSGDSLTVPASSVITTIVAHNGQSGAPMTLHPGDSVTLELTYKLSTGNYENFSLESFLPLPAFLTGDPKADDANSSWSRHTGAGLPDSGQWSLSSTDTVGISPTVTVNKAANSLTFNFGSNTIVSEGPQTISVLFTLKLTGQPLPDNLPLSITGQANQGNSFSPAADTIVSDNTIKINLSEPLLNINTGVVRISSDSTVLGGASRNWLSTGNTTSVPFTGTISSSTEVNGNLTHFEAGETLRLATAIENTGGSGAYGITTRVGPLPNELSFVGGSLDTANLKVVKGDGTVLVQGVDFSLSGSTVTLLDNGDVATLVAGHNGSAQVKDGSNLLVITYDTVALNSLAATTTLSTTASISHYRSKPDGPNFLSSDLVATATEVSASPTATIQIFSASDTDISKKNLVIGESALIAIKVTLPEGVTNNFNLSPNIPAGMVLDTRYGNNGYKVFTTQAAANAEATGLGNLLTADFNITPDHNPNNNSYLVAIKLIVSDSTSNHSGDVKPISVTLGWDNGNNGVSSGVTNIVSETILEPRLTISNVVTDLNHTGTQMSLVDAGDPLQYTITISNPAGASSVNAYDLLIADSFASQLHSMSILSAELGPMGFAPGQGVNVLNQFEISGTTVQTLGGLNGGNPSVNLTLAPGETIILIVNAITNNIKEPLATLKNSAEVLWSSIDIPKNIPIAQITNARTGINGIGSGLNNYAAEAIAPITVQYFDHAPQGISKLVSISAGTIYTFTGNDFGFHDPNNFPSNAFAGIIITTLPPTSEGALSLNGNPLIAGQFVSVSQIGGLSFSPAYNMSGNKLGSFSFQVVNDGINLNGGQNTDPNPKTFAFDVAFVNFAPAIIDQPISDEINSGIIVSNLPPSIAGVLILNGSPVNANQFIPQSQLGNLSFSPAANTNKTVSLNFQSVSNHSENSVKTTKSLTFNMVSGEDASNNEQESHQFKPSDFGFSDPNDNPADILAGLMGGIGGLGVISAGATVSGSLSASSGGGGIFNASATLAAIGGSLYRELRPFVVPLLLIAALVFALYFDRIVVTINSGEAGVLYHRFGGTDVDRVYPEGLHFISPLNIMNIYQVRKQVALHEFDVISNKGLTIHLALAVRYMPEYEQLGILHQRIGPDYLQRVILPQIESVMRKSLGNYSAEQIYTNQEGLLTKTILTALDEVGRNYVHVEDIIIRSILLPPEIITAIEDKLQQEEFLKSYEFRIKTADKEGERLKIEADAIKNYHKLVDETLTPTTLRYKGIVATQKLADSPNPKVVIIGSGKEGMPIILGADQTPAVPATDTNRPDQTVKVEKQNNAHE